VEQEDRHAEKTQFAGQAAQAVNLFLHRITDKDEGIDLAGPGLADRVVQHALDLRLAADAKHRAHDAMQLRRRRHPLARLAF